MGLLFFYDRHRTGEQRARILACLLLCIGGLCTVTAPASAEARPAVLTVKIDQTCYFPSGVFSTTYTEEIQMMLPAVNGLLEGSGSFTLTGTGPLSFTGPVFQNAEVRNDEELILHGGYAIWPAPIGTEYWGKEFGDNPIHVALEPGVVTKFDFEQSVDSGRCVGTSYYKIKFEREKQVWDVDLRGMRELITANKYSAFDPAAKQWVAVEHAFGFTFNYRLGARVELVRRKGKWEFASGKVTRAEAKAVYSQQPELYRTVRARCGNCDRIARLVGKPLSGTATDNGLRLQWPGIVTEASVAAVFDLQCAPGPEQPSCENARKMTSTYLDQDEDFLSMAAEHVLPLSEGTRTIEPSLRQTASGRKRIVHQYSLKKAGK